MSMTHIDGIAYEIDGDIIHFEQDCGLGEVDRVNVHRTHFEHLARECGLLAADRSSARTIGVLRRRLFTLANEINLLADRMHDAPGGPETFVSISVKALDRLANALVDDLADDEDHGSRIVNDSLTGAATSVATDVQLQFIKRQRHEP